MKCETPKCETGYSHHVQAAWGRPEDPAGALLACLWSLPEPEATEARSWAPTLLPQESPLHPALTGTEPGPARPLCLSHSGKQRSHISTVRCAETCREPSICGHLPAMHTLDCFGSWWPRLLLPVCSQGETRERQGGCMRHPSQCTCSRLKGEAAVPSPRRPPTLPRTCLCPHRGVYRGRGMRLL